MKFAEENQKWSNKDPEETQSDDDYVENVPRDDFVNSLSDLSGMYTEGGIVLPLRHGDITAGMCYEIRYHF